MLVHFETTAPQRPKLGQILHFLTPLVKVRGGVGEVCELIWRSVIAALGGSFMLLYSETTLHQKRLVKGLVTKIELKFYTFW